MKKLLFLFLAIAAISCSKDDDRPSTADSFTVKINGVSKTFTPTITPISFGGETYYQVIAAASQNEFMEFGLYKEPGEDIWDYSYFEYTKDGMLYEEYGGLDMNISHNDPANRFTGTFSGELTNGMGTANSTDVNFTAGKFTLNYTE